MVFQLFFGFGLLFVLLKNKSIRQKAIIPLIVIIFLVLAIVLRILLISKDIWSIYFNSITRIDAFLGGLLLAYLYSLNSARELLEKKKNIFLIYGTIVLLIAAVFTKGLSRWEHPIIDMVSYPILAVFSLTLINWIFKTQFPAWIDRFPGYNKIIFPIYIMKLPIIYMIKGVFIKYNLTNNLINNIFFITCSLAACCIFMIIWYFVVERSIRFFLPEDNFE
jgi:peptidoglycan/LPS O-acetylase OafA/YrhL